MSKQDDLDMANLEALLFLSKKRRRTKVTRGLGSSDYGKIQWKLADMLTEALKPFGVLDQPVHPQDFILARGHWTHKHQDVMRWHLQINLGGYASSAGSWETMTECVRNGFDIEKDDASNYADFMVNARKR